MAEASFSPAVGDDLPTITKLPTRITLFRYSAVTWNFHRIHYDGEWAKREGYPDVLVQAHLHGAYLTQVVTDWMPASAAIRKLAWRNRHFAIPGDTLRCCGRVTDTYAEDGTVYVACDLWEENQDGVICAEGSALLAVA